MVAVFAIGSRGVEIEKLDRLMAEEVAKVIEEGVSKDELQKAKNQKEAEIASSFGTMQRRAQSLAYYHRWYGDANRINTELDGYLSVTAADLQRVAREYLSDERRYALYYPAAQ